MTNQAPKATDAAVAPQTPAPAYQGTSQYLVTILRFAIESGKPMPALSVDAEVDERTLYHFSAARRGTAEEVARRAFEKAEDPKTAKASHKAKPAVPRPAGTNRVQNSWLLFCGERRMQYHRIFPSQGIADGVSQWCSAEWAYLKANHPEEMDFWKTVHKLYRTYFMKAHKPKEWIPFSKLADAVHEAKRGRTRKDSPAEADEQPSSSGPSRPRAKAARLTSDSRSSALAPAASAPELASASIPAPAAWGPALFAPAPEPLPMVAPSEMLAKLAALAKMAVQPSPLLGVFADFDIGAQPHPQPPVVADDEPALEPPTGFSHLSRPEVPNFTLCQAGQAADLATDAWRTSTQGSTPTSNTLVTPPLDGEFELPSFDLGPSEWDELFGASSKSR